jgi:serine/threonine protein kinase
VSDEHQSGDQPDMDDGEVVDSPSGDRIDRAFKLEELFRAARPELAADVVMIGRFEGFECIGRGGFGVVYRARDPQLGREVAVKHCPNPDPDVVEAFQREAKILAMFSHPNIVTVYEVGWHGKDFFYAMELIEGCDGAQFIDSEPEWRPALEVYEAAATGLAAAHAKGIVHADFKPANVLIGKNGRVCVADFGLAHSIGKAKHDEAFGLWAGTLPYMAPELYRGGQPNASTDQFALCVSLWETLYRCRPFEGKTPGALFSAMVSGKPRVPWGAPEVPRALRDLLRRGLSLDPSDRYPSMQALIEALAEIRSPMAARPVTASTTRGRSSWVPFVQGMAVSLGLGVAGVLGVLGWLDRPRDEPQRELAEPQRELAEPPPPSVVEPPCAMGDASVDLDPTVIEVCQLIRDGHFKLADSGWNDEHKDRLKLDTTGLGEHTLIIARTFVEQAESMQQTMPEQARAAASIAQIWVSQAAALLGQDDLRVDDVKDRAQAIAPPASSSG